MSKTIGLIFKDKPGKPSGAPAAGKPAESARDPKAAKAAKGETSPDATAPAVEKPSGGPTDLAFEELEALELEALKDYADLSGISLGEAVEKEAVLAVIKEALGL